MAVYRNLLWTLAVEGGGCLALSILLLATPIRLGRTYEDRMLRGLGLGAIVSGLISIGYYASLAFNPTSPGVLILEEAMLSVQAFLDLAIVLQWLVFVDHKIYHSPDHIRRRYRGAAWTALTIGVLLAVDGVFLATGLCTEAQFEIWSWFMATVITAIDISYILLAYRLVHAYERDRKPPLFLRLDVFVLPFVAGYLISFLTPISFRALGLALGIGLTWASVRNGHRYIEPESGFYNRSFLEVMREHAKRRGYPGGGALYLRSAGHGQALAVLLRELQPDGALLFALGGDAFLVLSATRWEKAHRLLLRSIEGELGRTAPGAALESASVICGASEKLEDYADRVERMVDEGQGIEI